MADLLSMMQAKAIELDKEVEEKKEESKEKKKENLRKLDEREQRRHKKKLERRAKKKLERIRKAEKMKVGRCDAAQELYSTEMTYVRNLMILTNGFYTPCMSNTDLLDSADVNIIFSNIKMISEFHKTFVKEVGEKIKNWNDKSSIGDVLHRLVPFLKMYTIYAANYENAISRLQELQEKHKKFAKFLEENLSNPIYGGLQLNSYLILPIQRVPRYKLLAEVILKNTEGKHGDFEPLKEALGQISEVADRINKAVIERANLARLVELQSELGAEELIEPGRTLIKEGSMKTNHFDKKKAAAYIEGGSPKPPKKGSALGRPRRDSAAHRIRTSTSGLGGMHGSDSPADLRKQLLRPSNSASFAELARSTKRSLSVQDIKKVGGTSLPPPSSLNTTKVILCNDTIMFFKGSKKTTYSGESLVTTWVKRDNLMPNTSFFIVTLQGCTLVYANSVTERREWCTAINNAVDALLSGDKGNKRKKDFTATRRRYTCNRQGDGWIVVYATQASPSEETINTPVKSKKKPATIT